MRIAILILLLLRISEVAFPQSCNDSLSVRLQTILTQFKLAGISVTLLKNNQIVAVGSAGKADIARSLAVTERLLVFTIESTWHASVTTPDTSSISRRGSWFLVFDQVGCLKSRW